MDWYSCRTAASIPKGLDRVAVGMAMEAIGSASVLDAAIVSGALVIFFLPSKLAPATIQC